MRGPSHERAEPSSASGMTRREFAAVPASIRSGTRPASRSAASTGSTRPRGTRVRRTWSRRRAVSRIPARQVQNTCSARNGVRRSISYATTRFRSGSAVNGRTISCSSSRSGGVRSTAALRCARGRRATASRRPVPVKAWRPSAVSPPRARRNKVMSEGSGEFVAATSSGRQFRPRDERSDAGTRSRICSCHQVIMPVSIMVRPPPAGA